MKDLEFIRSVVTEWPENATSVRLDKDGEICFFGTNCKNDFRPADIKSAKAAFVPRGGFYLGTGSHYTKEQWQGAKQ